MRLGITSIRSRLTLWSMAIIATVLVALGVVTLFAVQTLMQNAVDRELANKLGELPMVTVDAMSKDAKERFLVQQKKLGLLDSRSRKKKREQGAPSIAMSGRDAPIVLATGLAPPTTIDSFVRSARKLEALGPIAMRQDRVSRLIASRQPAYATVWLESKPYRVYMLPVPSLGRSHGYIQTSFPLEDLYSLLRALRIVFLILLPLALCATYAGGIFMTRKVLQPVRELSRAASEVQAEDLSRRLPVTGSDEFSDLAGKFNGMFDRLETSFEQLQTSVEQQKRFVADASHELRTPLTVIQGGASWALQEPRTSDEYRATLAGSKEAATRMERLIANLLVLARSDASQLKADLSDVLALDLLEVSVGPWRGRADIPCLETAATPPDLTVRADRDMMLQILSNLLENAVRYTPSDGSIQAFACIVDGWVQIGVGDTGAGIAKEHLPHVFDRFYRADAARSAEAGGTGLGLSLCKELAEIQGGMIEIRSEPGAGTTVTVRLPETHCLPPRGDGL